MQFQIRSRQRSHAKSSLPCSTQHVASGSSNLRAACPRWWWRFVSQQHLGSVATVAFSSAAACCEAVPSLVFKHLAPAEACIWTAPLELAPGLQEEPRARSELGEAARKVLREPDCLSGGLLQRTAPGFALSPASSCTFSFASAFPSALVY